MSTSELRVNFGAKSSSSEDLGLLGCLGDLDFDESLREEEREVSSGRGELLTELGVHLQKIKASVLLLESPKNEVRDRIVIDARVDVGEDGKKKHLRVQSRKEERSAKGERRSSILFGCSLQVRRVSVR